MEKMNLACIASGSGTDFNSIAQAWDNRNLYFDEKDQRINVNPKLLVSTKDEVACIAKAEKFQIPVIVVNQKKAEDFNDFLRTVLTNHDIDLVFLVGCIRKVFPIHGIDIYNIHPADPQKHGGDNMYSRIVHQHVLEKIADLLHRGRMTINDRFYTYPTVHEITDTKYDTGKALLQQTVEVPNIIVRDFVDGDMSAVQRLQDHVLPFEWLMLPGAVIMAARRNLFRRKSYKK